VECNVGIRYVFAPRYRTHRCTDVVDRRTEIFANMAQNTGVRDYHATPASASDTKHNSLPCSFSILLIVDTHTRVLASPHRPLPLFCTHFSAVRQLTPLPHFVLRRSRTDTMGSFTSKDATPQEQMKGYKREVDRAIRELDRERRKMETQNERLVADIKKAAKANQSAVVRIMAKDYVRVKRSVTKFYQLRTYLQGVGLQLQTMKSVDAMATAMRNTTKALTRVNARLNLPQLQAVMRSFGMETSKMEDTTEMIGDTLDDIFSADGEVCGGLCARAIGPVAAALCGGVERACELASCSLFFCSLADDEVGCWVCLAHCRRRRRTSWSRRL